MFHRGRRFLFKSKLHLTNKPAFNRQKGREKGEEKKENYHSFMQR